MTVAMLKLKKTDLTPRIGTEIRSDIETLLSGKYAADLRETLEQRGVLVFRGLDLTEDQQTAFAKTMGKLMLQGNKEVLSISLDKSVNGALADYLIGSFYWHIDMAMEDVPSRACFLVARKLSDTGGDTLFANTYAAWDDLPESEKKTLEKLRVVHTFENSQRVFKPIPTYAELKAWQEFKRPKVHPLVWTHQSGRKSLVLGTTASHVEGMSLEEGRLLLCKLQDWATQPQFVYGHKWNVGDLLVWDNTGTMHRAEPYPIDSGRLMTRATLEGEERVA
ncbi:MAG: TauD/TfdA family dioxygenase [Rhodospirillaceae bacterium]|nr:MAG: TauD/TfdA family dioxygenase [Rhodospirillaceae bacterium]